VLHTARVGIARRSREGKERRGATGLRRSTVASRGRGGGVSGREQSGRQAQPRVLRLPAWQRRGRARAADRVADRHRGDHAPCVPTERGRIDCMRRCAHAVRHLKLLHVLNSRRGNALRISEARERVRVWCLVRVGWHLCMGGSTLAGGGRNERALLMQPRSVNRILGTGARAR
jgi:hypothetical protein